MGEVGAAFCGPLDRAWAFLRARPGLHAGGHHLFLHHSVGGPDFTVDLGVEAAGGEGPKRHPDAPVDTRTTPGEHRRMPSPATASPLRSAVAAAAGYIGLMGLGMTAMHHGGGVRYGEPEMMRLIGPVEVLLTLWTLWAVRRQGGLAAAGLPLVRPRHWIWIVPLALPVLGGLGSLVQLALRGPLPDGKASLLLAAVLTTALVGFSEELMFRGVLLRGAWRQLGLFRAMLVSAVGFMLLHAVNVLGGEPVGSTGWQLLNTLVFGLAMAPVAVRLGTLWPLMLVHWGWDLLLFGHGVLGEPPPMVALAFLPAQLLLGVAGWWSLRGDRGKRLDEVEGRGGTP